MLNKSYFREMTSETMSLSAQMLKGVKEVLRVFLAFNSVSMVNKWLKECFLVQFKGEKGGGNQGKLKEI